MRPIIGVELEFYLQKNNQKLEDENLISSFIKKFAGQNPFILAIEKEQGAGQIEIKTIAESNISNLCRDIISMKQSAVLLAQQLGLEANFLAQAFLDDCGSALQINLNFINKQNHNLFAQQENQQESQILSYSIGGLLQLANQIMIFLAPNKTDYLRYDLELNFCLFKKKKYTAPVNLSWGYDNRSAAIRIPASKIGQERRLELRLAASNADIYLVIISTLLAIKYGIENHISAPAALYGNAFDEKYNLPVLIKDYQNAYDQFFHSANPLLKFFNMNLG